MFLGAVETDAFTAGFGSMVLWRDDYFKMLRVFRRLGGYPNTRLNQATVSGFDGDLAEVAEVKRPLRNTACADLVGLLLRPLVGDADLVTVADVAVRQHDIQWLADLVDGPVEAAPGADAVYEVGAHQNQCHPVADGLQALPLNLGGGRHCSGQVLFRIVANEATRIIEGIHDGVTGIDAQPA